MKKEKSDNKNHALRIEGKRIVDEQGRHTILRGINLVCKKKELGYVTACDESLFAKFRASGFNVIRLGLQWDGVEPEPGVYDDSYLAKIRQQAKWAADNGLYVFLDMHQDLYGIKFGDGAPLWATLDDGLPHSSGDLWSDAYLKSDAISASFDAFWENRLCADGVGLQDHFLLMWLHVAEFFKDCPNVIGYDLFNEPYPGMEGRLIFEKMGEGVAMALAASGNEEAAEISETDGLDSWTNEESKLDLLSLLEDMTLYDQLAKYSSEASQAFEKTRLQAFYDKLCPTLKKACPDWLCFQEASYFTNLGIPTGVRPVAGVSTIFAPHGYDLVVDTEHYEAYSKDRVRYIFEAHRKVQDALGIPVLIGEWGAFSPVPVTADLAKQILDIFDENLWSHSYWCWDHDADLAPYWSQLKRPYAKSVSGEILAMISEEERFELSLDAEAGESIIHHLAAKRLSSDKIHVEGFSAKIDIQPYGKDGDGGQIVLTHESGKGIIRINV